jgi:hypothetical protein
MRDVMQISSLRDSEEEPTGITRDPDEIVPKVNRRTFFTKDCNFNMPISDLTSIS